MMNKEIVDYIENFIIPQYENFDKAHSVEHVRCVINESLELAKSCGTDVEKAYVIAAFHDLGLCESRETHHLVSGEILAADKNLKKWFSGKDILLMKEAVEDHRASSKNPPRSIYGKIISEADRVIDPIKTIKRIVQFSLQHNVGFSKKEHFQNVIAHLHNKFAEDGYMKLYFNNSKNAVKLKELRSLIADEQKLKNTFEEIYASETKTKNQTTS